MVWFLNILTPPWYDSMMAWSQWLCGREKKNLFAGATPMYRIGKNLFTESEEWEERLLINNNIKPSWKFSSLSKRTYDHWKEWYIFGIHFWTSIKIFKIMAKGFIIYLYCFKFSIQIYKYLQNWKLMFKIITKDIKINTGDNIYLYKITYNLKCWNI